MYSLSVISDAHYFYCLGLEGDFQDFCFQLFGCLKKPSACACGRIEGICEEKNEVKDIKLNSSVDHEVIPTQVLIIY